MASPDRDHLLQKIKTFPKTPGVYLMKDKTQRIIYVGKAKNLYARVRQYFGSHDTRYQIGFLMQKVCEIDFLQTRTEAEALLLENSLIKKHKPRYNLFLKDDKSYLGLKITMQSEFPQLLATRRVKKDQALYFGPFTNSDHLRQVKQFIDSHFQLRTCSDRAMFNRNRPCLEYQIKRCSAPCVGYCSTQQYAVQIQTVVMFLSGRNKQLQRRVKEMMLEASTAENFEEAARLRDLLSAMETLLQGQRVTQLGFDFVDVIAFERGDEKTGVCVLMVRDAKLIDSKYYKLDALEDDEEFLQNFMVQYYSANSFIPSEVILPVRLKKRGLVEQILLDRKGAAVKITFPCKGTKRELLELASLNLGSHFLSQTQKDAEVQAVLAKLKAVFGLPSLPARIECYDISNTGGEDAVGSLVVFTEGRASPDSYKRFRIRTVTGADDFAMMREVLSRRFKRTDRGWEKPNLLVVDGGRGQLKQVLSVFEELKITDIACIAIAKGRGEGARAKGEWVGKKDEDIYIPGRKNPVNIKTGSLEKRLMQNIRDEAHRFAITYHKKVRDKKITRSFLDDIKGIGKKTKQALMKHFGSPEGVKNASIEELMGISGIGRETAIAIKGTAEQVTWDGAL
ncbi:MAG: excinuclease ABC subunit UvrC [Deltaproteobacteria bacterium]|nr:excinuclease ABC subunit UvrC [Deltaproteobacteria bacterium]